MIRRLMLFSVLFTATVLNAQHNLVDEKIGQENLDIAISQIEKKAEKFCQYLGNLGSPEYDEIKKEEEMKKKIPDLFHSYHKDPRYAKRYNFNSELKKQLPVSQHLNTVVEAAKHNVFINGRYEYRFDKIISQQSLHDEKKWTFVKMTSDGCKMYKNTIYITRYYRIIQKDSEIKTIPGNKESKFNEIINVYLLIDPKGTIVARLGDIHMNE